MHERFAYRLAKRAAVCLTLALITLTTLPAWPLGILVPRLPEFAAIQLGDAEVQVKVTNHLAKTRIVQEFFNPNHRQLEADFYFPVPREADVTDFVLYMNGKPVRGEVLEKEKAREIYEGIVRRMKDPGLLEWIDYSLFKVRVFPVPANGTQKVELEFAQPLKADQGMYEYKLPLKTPKSAAENPHGRVAGVKFSIELVSDQPLRNIYSPSHRIETDQTDPKQVKVTVPPGSFSVGGDFVLFYEASRKDIALSVLASRAAGEDGFFSLMVSPQVKYDETQAAPNDVAFVIDSSGSMLEGKKIDQARRALTYCISQLKEKDRFGLVRFSTEVEKYKDTLLPAAKDNIEQAKQWISKLEARGGTNISGALHGTLAMRPEEKSATSETARVYTIVFITDGLPTVGTTNPDEIISQVRAQNRGSIRMFTFGVGHDVNTKLLDRIAEETRAVSDYIKPEQDMEVPISKFFDKIARPAMVNLKLGMAAAQVYDLYPNPLPDLFYGAQLTVFGRYKKPGPVAIRLEGTVAGKPAEFVYEKTLPEKEAANDFIEKLWGTRKIGYLLDEIRAHGESGELKDEIIRLAKKYGVVTPYTSYLVTEDTPALAATSRPEPPMMAMSRSSARVPMYDSAGGLGDQRLAAANRRTMSRDMAFAPAAPMSGAVPESAAAGSAPALPGGSFGSSSFFAQQGKDAVAASKAVQSYKRAESKQEEAGGVRRAGGKTFRFSGGRWIDQELTGGESFTLRIKYMSDAYFAALRLNPALGEILALGDHVIFKLKGGVVEISPEGKDKLASEDEALLRL